MQFILENEIVELLKSVTGLAGKEIRGQLKAPRDINFGDFAFPVFMLAKERKMAPPQIAGQLAEELSYKLPYKSIRTINAAGGFINFSIDTVALARQLLPEIYEQGEQYGSSDMGQGRKVVIDLSSPNIAKPFHVGHLRSTVVGSCLYRLYEKLGYQCVGINHLGDWGTQFGKLIVAYKKFATKNTFESEPIYALLDMYIRFHQESKSDPSLEDQAREEFRKLENGEPQATAIWRKFLSYSLEEYKRIYKILNATIDEYTGESFYNDKMESALKLLEEKGLTEISREALIVDLEKYDLGAALLKKSDEATLYLTRDIAAMLYRKKTYDFAKMLYVVGSAQALHFKQLFKIVELMGYDWFQDCQHVEFGWIKFETEMMSTREGNIVFLDDVIAKSAEIAKQIILEKNPEIEDLEQTALAIGVGAVIYSDLAVKRKHDINFRWEDALNFDGNTGPYLQYTHTRLASLERKYALEITSEINYDLICQPEEKQLLLALYKYPHRLMQAAEENEPAIICTCLYELSQTFNNFYQRHRVISENPELTAARMLLIRAVRNVMSSGLQLLGLSAMERM